MSPTAWKPTPAAKVYEAFSAVADGRVRLAEDSGQGGSAEVESSGRDRRYVVEWAADLSSITANDNASYWQGYLGYPAVAALLAVGALHADQTIVDLFAGVPWHDLNARFKRDYAAAVDSVLDGLEGRGADRARIESEVAGVLSQLADLAPERPPRRRRPPSGG
ncbi:MAG TPA: hypothetical protein VL117_03845 [Thermoleophilia bacterium]|nr:hypothetical protein [Thermoleophilia bacterium]